MKIEYFRGVPLNVFTTSNQFYETVRAVKYSVEKEKLLAEVLYYDDTTDKHSYHFLAVAWGFLSTKLTIDYKLTAAYEIDEALK